MDSHQLIDAQFDRAVEVVQGFPKNGPIQTGYEEKLTMYSLYKQATVGNVMSVRPGIWDMLGRAKWDEWAKHKDLDPYEAKWLYVDALKKVLRKYSEKTVARDLLNDLESYGGDPSNLVLSHTLSNVQGSVSSGSTTSDHPLPSGPLQQQEQQPTVEMAGEETDDTSEGDNEETADKFQVPGPSQLPPRPQSSVSSHRYRTPMASLMATSPPPLTNVPETQPLPLFETPSAFAGSIAPTSVFPTSSSFVGQYSELSGLDAGGSPNIYPAHPHYPGNDALGMRPYGPPTRPASLPSLERVIENVQAHIAAVNERLESLESLTGRSPRSRISLPPPGGAAVWSGASGARSPADRNGGGRHEWDLDDLGLWSLVLNPAARGVAALRQAAIFVARSENRSPTFIVVRRLCLDVSFLVCVLAIFRALWRKSGVRRREVRAALIVLWRAVIGTKRERVMVDRGV